MSVYTDRQGSYYLGKVLTKWRQSHLCLSQSNAQNTGSLLTIPGTFIYLFRPHYLGQACFRLIILLPCLSWSFYSVEEVVRNWGTKHHPRRFSPFSSSCDPEFCSLARPLRDISSHGLWVQMVMISNFHLQSNSPCYENSFWNHSTAASITHGKCAERILN